MLELRKIDVVGEAEDGVIAVEKYKELRPDIVLMDIIMPRKTGLEAIEEIKAFDKESKFIVISSILQEKVIEEANQLGVLHYLVKPFEMTTLIDVIRGIFPNDKGEE